MSLPELDELPDRDRWIGQNFRTVDAAFARFSRELADLKRRRLARERRRALRSAAAARVNPDRLWFGWTIAAVNGVFILGAFAISFAGQYAFAEATRLDAALWWFIPLALDLPIVASAFTAAVFRKRRQHRRANVNWAFVTALTLLSSTIQATHVLDADGFFGGAALDWPKWLGVGLMAAMPWLVLFLSENLAGLLVKPTGEAAPQTPGKKPATRKRTR